MKHFNYLLLAASLLIAGNNTEAAEGITTLDLTKPLNPEQLNFDEDGAWDGVYKGEDGVQEYFEAQIFIMSHTASYGGTVWDGFAPCKSTVMTDNASYVVGCMAGGGIALDDSGDVTTDDNGNVGIDATVPYLVGYYNTMGTDLPSCQIFFNDGLQHEVVGVYVTNFPTAFYNCLYGNGYTSPFVNGDKFTLTIHGVAADQTEKTVEVDLVKYDGDMFQAIRSWKYVDLSSLGAVESIYFTMSSTDAGEWGMNTTAMFCLDKLMVKTEGMASMSNAEMSAEAITYDRATATVTLPQSTFAIIYNAAGQKVMATESQRISVAGLEKGIYFVKTATRSLRFIK